MTSWGDCSATGAAVLERGLRFRIRPGAAFPLYWCRICSLSTITRDQHRWLRRGLPAFSLDCGLDRNDCRRAASRNS